MDIVTPLNEEYIYEERVSVSQSDIDGKLTYANKAFCEISGYSKDELIGSTYQIIKHPHMPQSVFKKMWETISSGQAWTGLVKNLRKDGKFYWDDLSVLPIKNDSEELTGYISCARAASRKNIQENEELYEKMLTSESTEENK